MHLATLDSFRLHAACGWDPRPYILDLWVRSLVLGQILDQIYGSYLASDSRPDQRRGVYGLVKSIGRTSPSRHLLCDAKLWLCSSALFCVKHCSASRADQPLSAQRVWGPLADLLALRILPGDPGIGSWVRWSLVIFSQAVHSLSAVFSATRPI